jgi:hypothetical protein
MRSGRHVTRMTIYDSLHYSPEQAEKLLLSYPKHIRGARALGQPSIGEGAVWPIDDESITCAPFDIPPHWMEIAGLDFGWDHPTAAGRIAFDRESETYYVTQTYRKRQTTPLMHVQTLKGWGEHLPFVWGMEGLQTVLSDNPEQKQKIFRRHGLRMVDTHATFHDGGVGLERGVMEMYELMEAGRFKVFSTCKEFFEEKSTYHRKRRAESSVAQIVKVNDDVLDAVRYGYMMFRFAVPVSWRKKYGGRPAVRRLNPNQIDTRDIFGRR